MAVQNTDFVRVPCFSMVSCTLEKACANLILGVSLDSSKPVMLTALLLPVIGLRQVHMTLFWPMSYEGKSGVVVVGACFYGSFLTLKNRHKEIMITSLSLDFGEDVMAGAVVAFLQP